MSAGAALEEYAVAPPGKGAWVFLGLFTVVIPLMVLVALVAFPEHRPPPAGFAITALVAVSVAVGLLAASRRRSIRINGEFLEVMATF
ncbi:MAG: hypothetical protein WDZ60_09585, partial [Wenzhouxiangellaceae bacterium]